MRWNELGAEACPVARTLAVIGDRWSILLLRDALRGVTRFDEFHRRLGCSRATIANRLSGLVEVGVLRREAYVDHPPRHDYRLTDMGMSLSPLLMVMGQWGDAWRPTPDGYRIQRVHRTCGHAFEPVVHCSHCDQPILPGQVEYPEPAEHR